MSRKCINPIAARAPFGICAIALSQSQPVSASERSIEAILLCGSRNAGIEINSIPQAFRHQSFGSLTTPHLDPLRGSAGPFLYVDRQVPGLHELYTARMTCSTAGSTVSARYSRQMIATGSTDMSSALSRVAEATDIAPYTVPCNTVSHTLFTEPDHETLEGCCYSCRCVGSRLPFDMSSCADYGSKRHDRHLSD